MRHTSIMHPIYAVIGRKQHLYGVFPQKSITSFEWWENIKQIHTEGHSTKYLNRIFPKYKGYEKELPPWVSVTDSERLRTQGD